MSEQFPSQDPLEAARIMASDEYQAQKAQEARMQAWLDGSQENAQDNVRYHESRPYQKEGDDKIYVDDGEGFTKSEFDNYNDEANRVLAGAKSEMPKQYDELDTSELYQEHKRAKQEGDTSHAAHVSAIRKWKIKNATEDMAKYVPFEEVEALPEAFARTQATTKTAEKSKSESAKNEAPSKETFEGFTIPGSSNGSNGSNAETTNSHSAQEDGVEVLDGEVVDDPEVVLKSQAKKDAPGTVDGTARTIIDVDDTSNGGRATNKNNGRIHFDTDDLELGDVPSFDPNTSHRPAFFESVADAQKEASRRNNLVDAEEFLDWNTDFEWEDPNAEALDSLDGYVPNISIEGYKKRIGAAFKRAKEALSTAGTAAAAYATNAASRAMDRLANMEQGKRRVAVRGAVGVLALAGAVYGAHKLGLIGGSGEAIGSGPKSFDASQLGELTPKPQTGDHLNHVATLRGDHTIWGDQEVRLRNLGLPHDKESIDIVKDATLKANHMSEAQAAQMHTGAHYDQLTQQQIEELLKKK